jgi:hypothetical protein
LLKTMIDPATPASVKVRAAEAIFSHATKAIEIEDIEARVGARSRNDGRRLALMKRTLLARFEPLMP